MRLAIMSGSYYNPRHANGVDGDGVQLQDSTTTNTFSWGFMWHCDRMMLGGVGERSCFDFRIKLARG